METNPLGQIPFGTASCCGRKHDRDNSRLFDDQIESVQAKEHDHREERHPLVAVTVWTVLHDAVAICRSQARKIWTSFVRPFVSGSSQSRFQEAFVSQTRQASVFANLIKMNCVNHNALHPTRFGCLHALLGQLTERVAVTFRGTSSNCERFLRLGIVWREENTVFGFDSQKSVARSDSETISHVFRKSGAHGTTHSTYSDFFDHVACPVASV